MPLRRARRPVHERRDSDHSLTHYLKRIVLVLDDIHHLRFRLVQHLLHIVIPHGIHYIRLVPHTVVCKRHSLNCKMQRRNERVHLSYRRLKGIAVAPLFPAQLHVKLRRGHLSRKPADLQPEVGPIAETRRKAAEFVNTETPAEIVEEDVARPFQTVYNIIAVMITGTFWLVVRVETVCPGAYTA